MSNNRLRVQPQTPDRSISYLLSYSGRSNMRSNPIPPNGDRRFVRGPVPLPWLVKAGQTKGKALALGVYLWFYNGVKKTNEFDINLSRIASIFNTSRRSMQRALQLLEQKGLVVVVRSQGK